MKNPALPTLSPADANWLARTFDRNRAMFGGWRMDANDGGSGSDGGNDDGSNAGANNDQGDQGGTDKGFPANTPVAEMTAEQQAAYWRDKAQRHEGRNKELLGITGGKYGDALKADLTELEQLRDKNRTDGERAVEEAKKQARAEAAKELGVDAARMAFEFALGHDPEKNDQSTLIDTLDLTKVLTDEGKVDTAKVRDIASKIAPAAKDTGKDADYGGGRRRGGSTPSGVAAGAEMFAATRKKSTTS